tara:strand:+ start:361 stop:1041 length:681 start_codon:yes stop_codon:yes gene_type:complete
MLSIVFIFTAKKNRRGKMQQRFVVMSDQWIYNCKFKFHPTELHEYLWAVPYRALVKLCIYQKSPRVLTLFVDPVVHRSLLTNDEHHQGGTKNIMASKSGIKDVHKFIFRDAVECLDACYMIRLIHGRLTNGTTNEGEENEECELLPVEEDMVKQVNVVPFSTKRLFKRPSPTAATAAVPESETNNPNNPAAKEGKVVRRTSLSSTQLDSLVESKEVTQVQNPLDAL